jgi:Putative DNA-binding domain
LESSGLSNLLRAEESDVLERKASLKDGDAIRDTIIAFANDIAQRGGGTLVIGQAPDKTMVGLTVSDDEASRKISDIARTRCFPAIHVTLDFEECESKRIAIVKVKTSVARPHFRGECMVRQGSTNRRATDGESMILRFATENRVLNSLMKWQQEGITRVTAEPRPVGIWGRSDAQIVEITDTYVAIQYGGNVYPRSIPLSQITVGYDFHAKRPMVSFDQDG